MNRRSSQLHLQGNIDDGPVAPQNNVEWSKNCSKKVKLVRWSNKLMTLRDIDDHLEIHETTAP
jgi:hypothetical protein